MFNPFNSKAREERREDQQQDKAINSQKEIAAMDAGVKDSSVDYPYRPNSDADTLRYTQGVEDEIISNLIHELKNHILINPKNGEWEATIYCVGFDENGKEQFAEVPPKLNNLGILAVVNQARPFLNRNMMNSNFKEEKISSLVRNAYLELHRDLLYNRERYGLSYACDPNSISVIMRIYLAYVTPGPFRALNDGERRNNRSMFKSMDHTIRNTSGEQINKKQFGAF